MSAYEDFYENTSPFDEEVEAFKESLRSAVKQEIQADLASLRAENGTLKGKLANLSTLEQEATRAKIAAEQKINNAEVIARRTVEKEGLRKLLELLREPRYRLEIAHDPQPKCGKCDEGRKLHYTTPRGRESFEACECATTTPRWVVEEQLVHEVAKRSGKIVAWYHSASRYFDDDSFGSPTVLASADGVALEEMVKSPRDYGFTTEVAAQVLADALNEAQS